MHPAYKILKYSTGYYGNRQDAIDKIIWKYVCRIVLFLASFWVNRLVDFRGSFSEVIFKARYVTKFSIFKKFYLCAAAGVGPPAKQVAGSIPIGQIFVRSTDNSFGSQSFSIYNNKN